MSVDGHTRSLPGVVARHLNHPEWPVRLMAVYLLATEAGGDFGKVLDWTARQDENALVRSLAVVLGSVQGSGGPVSLLGGTGRKRLVW